MASLQTLRNKGGIIVAVVIGFALLAFVLGDLLTSGSRLFGSDQNNVGEIDGNKITYQAFASELDYLTEIRKTANGGQESNSDEQNEALRNQTWEQFVRKYAFKPSLDKLGLTVSTEEMVQLMGGKHTSPLLAQMFTNPQTGMFDSQYLANFIANIDADPTGRLQMFWNYLQQEVSDQAQMMKISNLVSKSAYTTSFEAKKIQELESKNYSVRFVASTYAKIADSTIKVTDAEVKDFYTKYPNAFKSEQSRNIEYVVFSAIPSDADRAAADKYVREMAEEFRTNATPMQFATLNSQSPMDTRYYKEGEMSGPLGTFAFEATTDQVFGPEISGDQYTVARISDVKVLPDSVDFSHIALRAGEKATADSLAAVIRKDKNFAEMAAQYSLDTQSAAKGGNMGVADPQTMPEVFAAPLMKAKKDDIIVVETPQSVHVIKVNNVKGESKKVQLAKIQYTIEPSAETRNAAFAQATSFATESQKDFSAAVAAKSLVKRSAALDANDRELSGIRQSREVVRWAYNSNPKDVSKVMEFGDNFVVATLTTINEKGVMPLKAAEGYIKSILIERKKGEMIAAQMAGATSVDDLAAKMALTVIEGQDVNFNTYIAPEVGLDPAFAGGICGMDASKISKPIIGRMAVYAAQITGSVENPVALEVIKARMNAESQRNAFMVAYQAFMDMSKINDFRYKFY